MNKPRRSSVTTASSTHTLRIIGGQWRGRRFDFPIEPGLRPTLDRYRETLFNWLMYDIESARCLDVFAGSGALGLEALSRYAKEVVFLEKASSASRQITHILTTLGTTGGQVIQTDSLKWLAQQTSQPFDIVFLDPPFGAELLPETCALLDKNGWLKTGTLIYLESENQEISSIIPASWGVEREKVGKNKQFFLLKKY